MVRLQWVRALPVVRALDRQSLQGAKMKRQHERLQEAHEILAAVELTKRATGVSANDAPDAARSPASPAEPREAITRARANLLRQRAALTRTREQEARK